MAKKRAPKPKKPIKYKSGLETKIKNDLNAKKQPFEYETELLPYTVPQKTCKYKPDFIIVTRSGKKIYIEGKGYLDKLTRSKMEFVRQQHPDKDIRFVFQRDNPIRKGSKTRYSDWAIKTGYPFTVSSMGHVPEDWLI